MADERDNWAPLKLPEVPGSSTVPPKTLDIPEMNVEQPPAQPASGQMPVLDIPEMNLDSITPDQKASLDRIDRVLAKRQAEQVEVERSFPGEVAASLGRGALGLAKLPLQVAKIVGADVLGNSTVKKAVEPAIVGLEEIAESPTFKPGKAAGGSSIELDRIIQDPKGVASQIASQVSNPHFWAAQLPEGALSMAPYFVGSWMARAGATALKYGKLVDEAGKAARVAEVAGDAAGVADATAKLTTYADKLAKIGRMGGFGMAMAQEAAQGEENLREYELKHPDKPVSWGRRVITELGTGLVAGSLEALSLERIFMGKKGMTLARKILDSVATEGLTEGAQSIVENAFAKYGLNDPDKKLTEGVVESVLVGAALGGLGGGAEKYAEYRQHVKDLAAKAAAEQQERQAQAWAPPAVQPWEEVGPEHFAPPFTYGNPPPNVTPPVPPAYRIVEPGQRPERVMQPEPEGGSPLVDQFGRPIYPTAHELALRKEPWERSAIEKWLVDQIAKGETVNPEKRGTGVILGPRGEQVAGPGVVPQPIEPMGTMATETEAAVEASKEPEPQGVSTAELPDLRTRVSQLAATVEETGDPQAAQELNQLLISNQKEIGDLFRAPMQAKEELKPIAGRLDKLMRQVEETGDPAAARELHLILAANRDILQGTSRYQIQLAAGREPEPLRTSSLEAQELATPEPKPKTPADTLAEVDQQKAAGTNQLESQPEGTRLTAPDFLGGSLAGAWRKTTLAGDAFWVNERTGEHKTSEAFALFLKDLGLEEPRRGSQGSQVKATTARGTTVDTQYEVMDVNDLTTSHGDALEINPAFPQDLQPRERERQGSQLQIGQIEQNLQPAFLGESPQAAEGAPVIGPDNLVESGNARTIALRRLYARNGAEIYRQWLTENASRFGINPTQIDQVQNPVLVRRRLSEVNRKQFVREANEPTVAAMSAVETARSDANTLKDLDILQHFISNDKGLISTSDNHFFINRFMESIVGPTERNRYQTSKGSLNQDGVRRIRNALFALTFGDSAALEKLAESTDDNARNITGAMTMMAARLASINKEIAKGNLFDLNITSEIGQAADILQGLRERGESVEDFLAQQKLFADVDPMVAELLQVFARFARSRVKLTAIFNGYAEVLEGLGNPKQMQIFGPKIDITKAELLQSALLEVEGTHGERPGQPLPAGVHQGETGSSPVDTETHGAPEGSQAGPEGGETGTTPPFPPEEVGGFDLTGGTPKTTPLETRLKELKDEYPDIDLEKAATVLRALPEAENHQVAAMSADQEMFNQVAKGNLSAEEKRLLLEKAATAGQQGVLPGLDTGAGGLFDQEPTPPQKPEKQQPKAHEKPADLPTAFAALIDRAMEPRGIPITPKDIATVAKELLNLGQEDLAQHRKEIEEAFEFALVQKAREIVEAHQGQDPLVTFSYLKKLYSLQPPLTSRTSSSVRNQAYSTPAPLAYLMSRWAGINPETWVYEPTGGNGMLLIGANPNQTWANELDPARAENLKAQGFDVSTQDAAHLVGTKEGPQEKSVDVVVANPPFGNLEKPANFNGYKITKLEHIIALDALKAMDDDGRAAIILGGHSFFTPWGQSMPKLTDSDRVFFNYLYSRYNVTHHLNIDGKVYERMGTKFPIRLITIEGRKAEPDRTSAPTRINQIEVAKTLDDIYTLLKGDLYARAQGVMAPGLSEGQPASPGWPGSAGVAGSGGTVGQPEGPASGHGVPGSLEGEGPGSGGPSGESRGPGGGLSPAGHPGAEGGEPILAGGQEPGGTGPGNLGTSGGRGPELPLGISQRPEPGTQEESAGLLQPKPGISTSGPEGGTSGTGGVQSGRVPPKSIGSGTQIKLPDGTIVTIKESAAPYNTNVTLKEEAAPYGEQTIEVVDAEGNVRRIPISQIQAVIDESGQEVQLSDQDRKEIRVFQKGQQVETNSGRTGQVTKIRGWGDKMVLTVQGPEGPVTVKPSDIKNIVTAEQATATSDPSVLKPVEIPKPEENKLQVPYVPTSQGRPMNTVAPRYMAEAVRNYLENLQEEIGDLDEFVRDRLDYKTKEDLYSVMGAEQIEGVALAIDAIERGTGGFVIGHQTGVGKGRMVAAIMLYAKNQGLVPIFLTENDGLFSAMYRDMHDIKADLNPLIVASNKDRARIMDNDGSVIRDLDEKAIKEAVQKGDLPSRFDAVFTTYYQINGRTLTGKMALLRNLAPRSIVILDESHKGAGEKSQTGAFLRSAITPEARGVIYSSATYAKRPDTMALYHRTELGNLNVDLDTIVDNLKRGGVPLQEWVAHQWALSGQMIRNELSFAGIDIPVEVDKENVTRDRQRSDDLTKCLREILRFSKAFSAWVADLNDDFQEQGEQVQEGFRGGISSTGFASVMHNKIAQLLFALRTDATIKEALTALKAGKKVVIGCYNTMGSFLEDMLKSGTIKAGDEVNMNFAQVLRKAADSVRKYTIKQHNGDKEIVHVKVEDMPSHLQSLWHSLMNLIDSTVTDVPAMPIDAIAMALIQEGYKVGEITGRQHVLGWETGTLRERLPQERYDKNTPVNNFNSGALDALIINSAGSTGISLHSSSTFKDQRPRHMILTQMSNEINEAVQLLGRIHRTGQVHLPSYMIKISSLPGEKRPLAILQKKMASLFANISAKGESAYSLDVNDIINRYGDQVIAEMFADDPSLNDRLSGVLDSVIDHDFIEADRDGRIHQILQRYPGEGDLTKRVTGWTSLQPVAVQEEVWGAIDVKYEELVEHLKQIGEYNLESEHLDLQAKPVAKTLLAAGDERGKSELSSPTYFESVDAKVQRKPMTAKEITARIEAHLKGQSPQQLANSLKGQIEADFTPWLEEKLALMRGAGNSPETVERFERGARNAYDLTMRLLDEYQVGTPINLILHNLTGVIYDIKYRPAPGSNPATPGNFKTSLAVDSSMRTYKTSMASIGTGTTRYTMSWQNGWGAGSVESPSWDERIATLTGKPYERRYIVTGNLLGNPIDTGQMAYFTRADGELTSGFVMPLNFDPSGYPELQTVSLSQAQALRILQSEGSVGSEVSLRMRGRDYFNIVVPAAKKTGGKYYLDENIHAHVENGEFFKVGSSMQANINSLDDLKAVLDILYKNHAIVMQTPRSTFEKVIGVQQDEHKPLEISEGRDLYRVKTAATMGRQIVPNSRAIAEHQADEMRAAYGSQSLANEAVSEIQKRAMRTVRKLSRAGVPGSLVDYRNKVAREYSEQKWVNLTGRRLTPGLEHYEIAELFQIYRSPRQENLHVIYTDQNNVILAHNMISSGTLASVNVQLARLLTDIKFAAARLGAAKVHFMHNHPSGDPSMSTGDKLAFNSLYQGAPDVKLKGLGDLMGEFIVIDHGRFSYIKNGTDIQGIYRATPGLRDWLESKVKITSPADLAKFATSVRMDGSKNDANKVTLIFTNTKNQVQGWTVHRKELLDKPVTKVKETLMQMAKAYDASQVSMVMGDFGTLEGFLTRQIQAMAAGKSGSFDGWLMEVQTTEGQSLRAAMPEFWQPDGKPELPKLTRGFLFEGTGEFRSDDQENIEQYREKYLAPRVEEKSLKERAAGLKGVVTAKLQNFYDQTIDRWGAWERAAARATREGAIVPAGENVVNTLSFMRGVEGRVRQGTIGDYIYQDSKAFDENLGMEVFTGEELMRKGPSLKVRLEDLKKLAEKRGAGHDETMADLETFMVAQRDLELAGETGTRKPGEIKGVHPEESKQVLDSMHRKYGEDYEGLTKVAESVREWGDEMILQPLRQVGFIDPETYAKIKEQNQYYIPYKRLLDEVESYIAANAAAVGVPGRVIKEIKGSERKVLDPFQMWIDLAHKAAYAYGKNKTMRSMYVTAKAASWEDVREIPAKYLPVDFLQKQEIDNKLRPQLVGLANDLGIKVRMVAKMRGRRLGQFKSWISEEVKEGKLSQEMAKEITVRFATFEATLAHELGHGIDDAYGLVTLLIENGTSEMKKELNRIADQRAGEAPSKSYKRYIRKKEEQVAEFVSRYIIDRRSVERLAPNALAKFENFLRQSPTLKPLLSFRLSHQAGMLDFANRVWARSPLPPEPGTIPYFRDGKRRWLKLPPDLYQATQSAMPAEMGVLMRIAKFPADTLRAGAIMVPEFALARNPVRDVVQAWIFSRFGFNPFKWVRDAVGLIAKDEDTKELQRQWEAGGGPLAALAQSFIEPEKITTESILGDPKKFKYFTHPLDALRYASAFLENLTRFSIYKQAREKGLSHTEAIHEARRTTLDFARSGAHPTVRYLNMIIPFWNASIQGVDKLFTELTGPNKKAVYRRLGMLAGVSMLIWAIAHQDDRYKELEDWEKNYFWHLPLGADVPMLRIPKPFEAGILFGSTFERLLEWCRGENPKGIRSALAASWDAATPEIIPTIIRPYIEAKANYDFFRGRPIEDAALQRLPVQLRAKPWTTETAKAMGNLIGISPVQVEHFIRTWGGGLGANYYLPGVDVILRKAGVLDDLPQPAREQIQNIWGVRSFFTQTPTGYRARSVNDFFERQQEVLQADVGWKALWNAGRLEDLDRFLAAHPEAMFARIAIKYMNDLGKIKKERAGIVQSKALTPEQKKAKLDALDARIVTMARAGNAFMSQDVAEALKMPSRFIMEGGLRKSLDLDDYYKMVAESTTDAFDIVKKDPRFFALEEETRNKRLASLLRQMRDEYKQVKKKSSLTEVIKPFRFKSLADKPTRRERAEWPDIFGPSSSRPFFVDMGV